MFQLDKFVLSKSGKYVEKWYMRDEMRKLNIMIIIKLDINKDSIFGYMLESFNPWHGRL